MARPARYTQALVEEYTRAGYWRGETFAHYWQRNAQLYPDGTALCDSRHRLTWSQAHRWTQRVALAFLELGLKRDELLVGWLPNGVELYLLRVACEKAGVLWLPIIRNLRRHEVEYILRKVEAAGVVVVWKYREIPHYQIIQELRPQLPKLRYVFVVGDPVPEGAISLDALARTPFEEKYSPDLLRERSYGPLDVSLILPTTGSTGFPKFAQYPVCTWATRGREQAELFGITHEDVLVALGQGVGPSVLPQFVASAAGAQVVIVEPFQAEEALKVIQRERATIVPAVPSHLIMMLNHPRFKDYDLSSVRIWYATGAPLPHWVGQELERRTRGVVINGYGGADFGGWATSRPDDPPQVRLFTVGKPRGGTVVRLVDDSGRPVPHGEVGEVWGRGPSCSTGYYRDPEADREAWTQDGWFRTGDLARWDEGGNLVLVGRKKDVINRGGQKIIPEELEEMIGAHPQVLKVAVVGMPDPVLGEKSCAYVIPRSPEPLSLEDITTFLRGKGIASYKLPERLEVVESFPMISEEKVDKKALREDITRKLREEGVI